MPPSKTNTMSRKRPLPFSELFLRKCKVARKEVAKKQVKEDEDVIVVSSILVISDENLLIEILCRIPCKHVIQCKTVCKIWNSVISSPYFVRRLIDQQQQLDRRDFHKKELVCHSLRMQFVITRQHLDRPFSLDFLPSYQGDKPNGMIVGSCHGLLLCSQRGSNAPVFCICNPFTRQWTEVPPAPRATTMFYWNVPTGFICDPFYQIDDQQCITLNPNPRFTILRAYSTTNATGMEFDVDVFSSETGMWRNIMVSRLRSYKAGPAFSLMRVVNYHGRMFFQLGQSIIVFDPSSNKLCGDIELPQDSDFDHCPFDGLFCCQDSLWMCYLSEKTFTLYIWKLKDNGISVNGNLNLSWSLERQVVLPESDLGKRCRISRVLAMHPDDPNFVLLRDGLYGANVSWNLTTGTMANFEILGHYEDYFCSWVDAFFLEVPVCLLLFPQ